MATTIKHGSVISADGATWSVMAVGATENGATYVHLASLCDGTRQRNGFRPKQCCGWLRDGRLLGSP